LCPQCPQRIIVRGTDGAWEYNGAAMGGAGPYCGKGPPPCGKQAHIASAWEELSQRRARWQAEQAPHGLNGGADAVAPFALWPVTRASTLLIDDDHSNIEHALANGEAQ